MLSLIILGSCLLLVFWYLVSREFYLAASMKGYPQKKYLVITFFFGILGALLVVALPDRNQPAQNQGPASAPVQSEPQDDTLPEL